MRPSPSVLHALALEADLRPLSSPVFVIVNIWTIFIHDSDMISGHWLENVINGPSHHTLHHLHFTVNYGQYFTWSDRVRVCRQPVDVTSLAPTLTPCRCPLSGWRLLPQARPKP